MSFASISKEFLCNSRDVLADFFPRLSSWPCQPQPMFQATARFTTSYSNNCHQHGSKQQKENHGKIHENSFGRRNGGWVIQGQIWGKWLCKLGKSREETKGLTHRLISSCSDDDDGNSIAWRTMQISETNILLCGKANWNRKKEGISPWEEGEQESDPVSWELLTKTASDQMKLTFEAGECIMWENCSNSLSSNYLWRVSRVLFSSMNYRIRKSLSQHLIRKREMEGNESNALNERNGWMESTQRNKRSKRPLLTRKDVCRSTQMTSGDHEKQFPINLEDWLNTASIRNYCVKIC